jgi:hypothetical protein
LRQSCIDIQMFELKPGLLCVGHPTEECRQQQSQSLSFDWFE